MLKNKIITTDIEDAVNRALAEAHDAVSKSSYGVGGIMVDARTGDIITSMQNAVIYQKRLFDPTAHGERQLVDWYFSHKDTDNLPPPEDIIIVTTLDPCCMCTGSILSAGFKAVVSALDTKAGINFNGKNNFPSLEGKLLSQIENSFSYPEVDDDSQHTRESFGEVPDIFLNKKLMNSTVIDCSVTFTNGATEAKTIINNAVLDPSLLLDPCNEIPDDILHELKSIYPNALEYRAPKPGWPDDGLLKYLEKEAAIDKQNGGDGDSVAFLDYFGNLIICMHGMKNVSPIRTAYMETIRLYSKLRFELTVNNNVALRYLHEPKYGTFVFYKGFDKSAQSFADLGAYGSTILEPLTNDRNLLYYYERIPQQDLEEYISNMPPRYSDLIKPKPVRG